jgi:MYXO-CTERM domain-containing protein
MSAMVRLTVLTSLSTAVPAGAFSVATSVTAGCHERITFEAAAAAGLAPTRPVTRDDLALHATLPFLVREPWDRATLALLIGVRQPDFHGAAAHDLAALAAVHLSPNLQHEHCLRGPDDDGASGDAAALDRCSAFIEGALNAALLAGPEDEDVVTVALTTGPRPVRVLARPYHLGRALHALQDSFAHGLRDEDFRRVRAVLNYVDPIVARPHHLHRDGHPHLSAMDACGGVSLTPAAVAARDASQALLAAFAVDGADEARRATARRAVDLRWHYAPACAADAAWCPAAQALLDERLGTALGCSSTGSGGAALALVVGLAWATRRRRPLGALLLTAGVCTTARAEAPQGGLAGVASLGASAERGAFVVGVGLRLPLSSQLEARADLEWNPWFDALAGKTSAGAFNGRLGARLTWARGGAVSVGSSLGAGLSVLAHDTVGARLGSVGPCVVLSPVDVVLPGPGTTRLELAPEVALVIPSLSGIPLLYPQYRLTLSVRLGPGT